MESKQPRADASSHSLISSRYARTNANSSLFIFFPRFGGKIKTTSDERNDKQFIGGEKETTTNARVSWLFQELGRLAAMHLVVLRSLRSAGGGPAKTISSSTEPAAVKVPRDIRTAPSAATIFYWSAAEREEAPLGPLFVLPITKSGITC